MKRIFVPIFKDKEYLSAFNFATLLDEKYSMKISALLESDNSLDRQSFLESIRQEFSGNLQHNESDIDCIITEDKISDELLGIAAKYRTDITVSSYENKKVREDSGAIPVSDIVKLIKQTKHNFIVIPDACEVKKIEKIVFPVNAISKVRHKVTIASQIAHMTDAEIHLVSTHATNDSSVINRCNLYTKQILNHFDSIGLKTLPLALHGKSLADLTVEYATEIGADLTIIIPETASGIRLFSQSYLSAILHKSTNPVLVVAPRKSKVSSSFSTQG